MYQWRVSYESIVHLQYGVSFGYTAWWFSIFADWRVVRVPWRARRSNQSILKEISPEYSLEGLMLKLKLQYFGHLVQRADSLEKTLMLGKIKGRRRRHLQRIRRLDGITDSMDMSLSKLRETVRTGKSGMLQSVESQRVRRALPTEQHSQKVNRTTGSMDLGKRTRS